MEARNYVGTGFFPENQNKVTTKKIAYKKIEADRRPWSKELLK